LLLLMLLDRSDGEGRAVCFRVKYINGHSTCLDGMVRSLYSQNTVASVTELVEDDFYGHCCCMRACIR
jgi:hypothetical protein